MTYIERFGNVLKQAGPVTITHNGSDSVTASTRRWHFVNATFTQAYIGALITIAGASNAGNNGVFKIESVVNGTDIITVAKGVLTDETFGGGVTQSVALDRCWNVNSAVTQIQVTFADGTVVQLNGADAVKAWDNLKLFIRQAKIGGTVIGDPVKWTFSSTGSSTTQVDCNTGSGA